MCDSLALSMGLQNGDKIVSLDNKEVERFNMVLHDLIVNKTSSIQVERDGQVLRHPCPGGNYWTFAEKYRIHNNQDPIHC